MARSIVLAQSVPLKAQDVEVIYGESISLTVAGNLTAGLRLTIGNSLGGAVLLEAPSTSTGVMTVDPALMSVLGNGTQYYFNVWKGSGASSERLAFGLFSLRPSIIPTGTASAAAFLGVIGSGDVDQVVVLTMAEYEALATKNPRTLYLVR